MSRPTIRQQSVEQPFMKKTPQLQVLLRKQKSADDKRSCHSNTPTHFNKSSKSKKGNSWGSERSKVRIAWNSQDDANVEVVASKIGTVTNKKTNLLSSIGSTSILESDKATILYSRQELAERLRLAWKQREANKSNIDIFLAHGTADDESRSESRLSLNNNHQNNEKEISLSSSSFVFSSSSSSSSPTYSLSKSQEDLDREIDKDMRRSSTDARSKRASFQSGTNLAFTGLNNTNKISMPSVIKSHEKKLEKQFDKSIYKSFTTPIIDTNKTKRTNSAPPLQRPVSSVTLGCLPSASSRTKVNIIIDTPKIVFHKDEKVEKKNFNSTENGDSKNVNSFTPLTNNSSTTSIDKSKGFVFKKRTRSGKRRVEEVDKKNECKSSNLDVVTMVSLISDADSDSEVEKYSPRDNKLVRQLKNNLPTASIIKQCPTMTNRTNISIVQRGSEDSLISRRVFKTVSFQQDSVEKEDNIRKIENNKRNLNYNEGLSKMMMQHQSQLQQVIQDDAHEENRNTWQYDMSSKNSPSPIYSNYWESNEDESSPVMDNEKRCLIVPIDDRIDKKRKLLLQRTKSVPSDVTYMDQPLTMQIEEKDCPISVQRQADVGPFIHQIEPNTVLLQTSLSKMIQKKNIAEINSTNMEALNADVQPQEPYLKTTKEKECWHLYKKMCDKGVCVSFDTVLRGMLTPTEYRLRRRKHT